MVQVTKTAKSSKMTTESTQPTVVPVSSTETTEQHDNDIVGTVDEVRQVQSKAYDKITSTKGTENGLFRCCMKAIRSGHVQSNRLRMGIVVAGMFTDIRMYRDIVCCFYSITAIAESKMYEFAKSGDPICIKLVNYKFSRTTNYEQDLQKIFSITMNNDKSYNNDDWKKHASDIVAGNKATQEYIQLIENATDGTDSAAVLFVLWGGLIIGGGALAKKRILKLCNGDTDCIHLYDNINYDCTIEREYYKEQFYIVYDSLASNDTNNDDPNFEKIIQKCSQYMNCNNTIFITFQRNPWWYQPLYIGTATTSIVVAILASYYVVWSQQKGRISK